MEFTSLFCDVDDFCKVFGAEMAPEIAAIWGPTTKPQVPIGLE